MPDKNRQVCPVERSASLDNRIRRWVQNPRKILEPYINEGMVVLDLGCGPGFFSLDMALMVGESGRIIACDMQDGMLQKLRSKIQGTEFENRIALHKCEQNKIGVTEKIDFALAFYMIHEVPEQAPFFAEIISILKPDAEFLIVEPPFHVSKSSFIAMVGSARDAGFKPVEEPKIFLSKSVLLKK